MLHLFFSEIFILLFCNATGRTLEKTVTELLESQARSDEELERIQKELARKTQIITEKDTHLSGIDAFYFYLHAHSPIFLIKVILTGFCLFILLKCPKGSHSFGVFVMRCLEACYL